LAHNNPTITYLSHHRGRWSRIWVSLSLIAVGVPRIDTFGQCHCA